VLFALTFLVSLFHFGLTFKLPYGRTAGYFLPAFVLGAASVVERTVRTAGSAKQRLLIWGVWAAATAFLATHSLNQHLETEPMITFVRQAVQQFDTSGAVPTYMVIPPDQVSVKKHLPSNWLDDEDDLPKGEFQLYLLTQYREELKEARIQMQAGRSESPVWVSLPPRAGTELPASGRYSMTGFTAKPGSLSPPGPLPKGAIVFTLWRPDPRYLGLDGSALVKHVEQYHLPYIRRNVRASAKLDFYRQLHGMEFIITSAEDLQTLRRLLEAGVKRFGGEYQAYWCMLP
jgi:hypothetical protein